MELKIKIMVDTNLTLQWSKYNHDYEKRVQDIRLKGGSEIIKCYPNAGKWCCLSNDLIKDIPDAQVTHTRLHNNPEFNKEATSEEFASTAPIREGVDAEELLNEILAEDAAKLLLHDTMLTRKHNGIEYDMVRKDLAVLAMHEFAASQLGEQAVATEEG